MSRSKSIIQQSIETTIIVFKKDRIKSSERRIMMTGAIVATLERAHVKGIISERKMHEINDCAIALIRQDEEIFNKKSVCEISLDNPKSRKVVRED